MKMSFKSLSVLSLGSILVFGVLQSCNEPMQKEMKPIVMEDMDLTVSPKENFYQYANGGWIKSNPLPSDRSRFGSFDALSDRNEKQIKEIFAELSAQKNEAGSVAQKIGDFYAIGMDSIKLNEEGINPLNPEFKNIEAIASKADLNTYISYLHNTGIGGLFNLFGMADSKNSEQVVSYLWQGGLGMPDRDYYTDETPRADELRAAYIMHVKNMFMIMNDDEQTAQANAETVMQMETRLAKASMTRLDMRTPSNYYNKTDLKGLEQMASSYDWKMYFDQAGLGDPGIIIVGQPSFYKEMSSMLDEVSINNWKTYFRWHLIHEAAPYLSDNVVNENFDFFGKTLRGTPQLRPRWKRVQGTVDNALSEAIGQIYVQKYFPEASKKRMIDLVENLRFALGQRIDGLTWMSETTKAKAQEKLAAINVKIGYPDKWRDYDDLAIEKDSYVMNVLRSGKFETEYNRNKINKPVDKSEWGMPPQMVNAYYNPSMNEIVFPAGILQPPFFFKDGDDAVNYGAIGVVIGHETTHGFDDKGSLYDKTGNLNNWWTEEDTERFNERTQVLVNQFNSFVVLGDVHANGELSLGENIADLGGLNIAFTAFKKATEGKDLPKIDGFTPEQRFFIAYSHVWAQNVREAEMLRLTKEDVHSLGEFRVNGPLPNIQAFYDAFDVKEGDAMFLPVSDRAIIW
ncbi:MAG: M13 family metallopeptidase [Bacteroidales bacterium]|nr:M13 family metallopeptidase [Bacteroidales bacterium]